MTTSHREHIIRADRKSRVPIEGHAGEEFVMLQGPLGSVTLIPLSRLDPSEEAVFRHPEFLRDTLAGLDDVANGRVKSLDWICDLADE